MSDGLIDCTRDKEVNGRQGMMNGTSIMGKKSFDPQALI